MDAVSIDVRYQVPVDLELSNGRTVGDDQLPRTYNIVCLAGVDCGGLKELASLSATLRG